MKQRMMVMAAMFVMLAMTPVWVQAEPALPPRPTIAPMPAPNPPDPAEGGWIALRVHLSNASLWQDLWTVVQWQDQAGNWHTVEGWQGAFDRVAGADGFKTWWVAPRDRGKGPFRWVVYQKRDGVALQTSDSFALPRSESETIAIELR